MFQLTGVYLSKIQLSTHLALEIAPKGAANFNVARNPNIIIYCSHLNNHFMVSGPSGSQETWLNTMCLEQNGCHFPDNIFKYIFLNEINKIPIWISLKFVPRSPVDNEPTLVQVMAWRRTGDKPLSESMMVRLPMNICVTRPQWVDIWRPLENGHNFADDFLTSIFLYENCCGFVESPLKFVRMGPFNNKTL